MLDVNNLNQICIERNQRKHICLEMNALIDTEIEQDTAQYEQLREEINSKYWEEDDRLLATLNGLTCGLPGDEIVRALFRERNGWTVDELHERMPRFQKSSIATFCNKIGAYSEGTGRYWL